jgi:DNA-binding protein YbaB
MTDLTTFLNEATKAISETASPQVDVYSLEEYVNLSAADHTICLNGDYALSFVIRDIDVTNAWQWIHEVTRVLCAGSGDPSPHDVWSNISIIDDEHDGCVVHYLAFVANNANKQCVDKIYGVKELIKRGHVIDFKQFIANAEEKLAARKEKEEPMMVVTVKLSVKFEMYGEIELENIELPEDLVKDGDRDAVTEYISDVYNDHVKNKIQEESDTCSCFEYDFSHFDYDVESIECE